MAANGSLSPAGTAEAGPRCAGVRESPGTSTGPLQGKGLGLALAPVSLHKLLGLGCGVPGGCLAASSPAADVTYHQEKENSRPD